LTEQLFDFPERLEFALNGVLPGVSAQMHMAMRGRDKLKTPADTDRKDAAVIVLLFLRDDVPHILYMRRTEAEGLRHSGQISFPGGRAEESDADLKATALRETSEEVGVDPDAVRVIGSLTSLYIPVSNFMVHPFVGWLDEEPEFTPEPLEVAEIIVAPLRHLQDPANRVVDRLEVKPGMWLEDVPYYDLFGQVLWGATAMITSELLELIKTQVSKREP